MPHLLREFVKTFTFSRCFWGRVFANLETYLGQSRMVIRPPAQGPMKQPVFVFDRKIIDAGVPEFHEPRRCELQFSFPYERCH